MGPTCHCTGGSGDIPERKARTDRRTRGHTAGAQGTRGRHRGDKKGSVRAATAPGGASVPTLSLSPPCQGDTSGTGSARPGPPAGNDVPKPSGNVQPPVRGWVARGGQGDTAKSGTRRAEGTKGTRESPAETTPARAPGRAGGLRCHRGVTEDCVASRGGDLVASRGQEMLAGVCPVPSPWRCQRELPAPPRCHGDRGDSQGHPELGDGPSLGRFFLSERSSPGRVSPFLPRGAHFAHSTFAQIARNPPQMPALNSWKKTSRFVRQG